MSTLPDDPADDPLTCPLCGYDLRGLPEHRYPECGHALDPDELRSAKDERRQWLFEHARRRVLRAFVLTTLSSLWPPDLWRRNAAAYTINVGRLAQWSTVWLVLAGVAAIVSWSTATWRLYQFRPTQMFQRPIDSIFGAAEVALRGIVVRAAIAAIVVTALWPFVTAGMFLLLGASLNAARVGRAHIVRILAYAMPVTLLPAIGVALVSAATSGQIASDRWRVDDQFLGRFCLSKATAITIACAAVALTFHLGSAASNYLRIPRPWTTMAIVQLATWLTILVILNGLAALAG